VEEASYLNDYFPLFFKDETEQAYLAFLWDAFEGNYSSGNFQFALLAYHMLAMSCIYFKIWQIKQTYPDDFKRAVIGFVREEKELLSAATPFAFHVVQERTVLRLLRLIDCDNAKIGQYVKLVDERNKTAHPNGHIYCRDADGLDPVIKSTLRALAEIEVHSKPLIERCYETFLLQSSIPDDREHLDDTDQVREVLIHENYLSKQDVDICVRFDISRLNGATGFTEIQALHEALKLLHADD
jgi:hypothetical protein